MKPHLQCAEQQVSRSNLTKYCACHAERLTYLVLITYETSFTVRGATGVTIQPHQILRLPRKIELQNFWQNLWKQMKRHFQCGADPTMIREWSDHDPRMKTQTATRLATEVTFRPHHEHFLLKNTTFRAQSYIQTFTKYCACHEKSHLNVTKYCACHEKWHLNFTKYCACHEKWHLNFTKYCTCHEKWHLNFTNRKAPKLSTVQLYHKRHCSAVPKHILLSCMIARECYKGIFLTALESMSCHGKHQCFWQSACASCIVTWTDVQIMHIARCTWSWRI